MNCKNRDDPTEWKLKNYLQTRRFVVRILISRYHNK